MGARNQVGMGLLYRPASLCSLATQFQTRFLEPIPRPIAGPNHYSYSVPSPHRLFNNSSTVLLAQNNDGLSLFCETHPEEKKEDAAEDAEDSVLVATRWDVVEHVSPVVNYPHVSHGLGAWYKVR